MKMIKYLCLAVVSIFITISACTAQENAAEATVVQDAEPVQLAQADTAQNAPLILAAAKVSNANRFNRLLKKDTEKNAAPPKDGIHDTKNEATHVLQPPKVAYKDLPKSPYGNYVDWVKALDNNKINPRYDRVNAKEEPFVMDMDIVRPVKASVPDVVFPHRQHTEWLHCSNCHPKIFKPQRLSNQISMSAILLGEKCGVCHGKVSFPITTKSCKKCHSKPKPKGWKPPLSKATVKNPWR